MIESKTILNNTYEVYSDGKIFSLNKKKYIKPIIVKDGVHKVILTDISNNSNNIRYSIHRLVASLFIPNPDGKPQVDHIDGDKSNNSVSNLRWCTNYENQMFRDKQGNSGKEGISKKIVWGDVEYPSIKYLARLISNERGSKHETVVKELKKLRYCSKIIYGKFGYIP